MIDPKTNECYLVQTVNPVPGMTDSVLDEYSLQASAYAEEVKKVQTEGQYLDRRYFSFLAAARNPSFTPMNLYDVVQQTSKCPDSPLVSDSDESSIEENSVRQIKKDSFDQQKFDEELERLE